MRGEREVGLRYKRADRFELKGRVVCLSRARGDKELSLSLLNRHYSGLELMQLDRSHEMQTFLLLPRARQ